MDSSAGQALSFEQVQKLRRVLSEPIEIHPPNNFPALNVAPASLVKVVRQRLLEKGIQIRDIRMNGSAASHCLREDKDDQPQIHFNDIDLIFGVSIEREYDFHVIKEEVLMSLLEFFPEGTSTDKITSLALEETYVKKMVLVSNRNNKWSLFSLGDRYNRSIELKFVSFMKRQFEFTVDSFQIILDSFFDFGHCTRESSVSVTQSFFPSVQAVSVYHDYSEALDHLNNQLIHTEAPEEIRGGGLLKYCSLLVNGYQPADPQKMEKLEPYMCSRFFIDFPSANAQYYKILKYINARFLQSGQGLRCIDFLGVLFGVVNSRAMCLVESERQKTISVITFIQNAIMMRVHMPMLPVAPYSFHPPPNPYVNPMPFPLNHPTPPPAFQPVHWQPGPSHTAQVR